MSSQAEHFGAEEVDLNKVVFTLDLLACVPGKVAHFYRVVPVGAWGGCVRIAFADLSDLDAIDSVHTAIQRDLEVVIADRIQIDEFLPRLYPEGVA